MCTFRSKITLGLKIHMPKPANRTRSIRQAHWLATTAVLAIAFAAALLLYAVAPDADQRELRAQGGNAASTDVTVIPRPPVETPDDADKTTPWPDDGQRTIVPPESPDWPAGSITSAGSVALDWNDVPGADSYLVGLFTGEFWSRLPWNDVTVQYSGSSAQIDNLPNYDTYYLRVRAENSAGDSRWSAFVVIPNDATDQATSTPTPTPDPVATATPTPTPTPTSVTGPTATPTTTATPSETPTHTPTPTNSNNINLMIQLLAELRRQIYTDSTFIEKESEFLDCMERVTGDRPASFDTALEMYSGETIQAFEGCDEETDVLETYHTLSVSKLGELTAQPSGRNTEPNPYAQLLDDDAGTAFLSQVGSPELVREFAYHVSNDPVTPSQTETTQGGTRSSTRSSQTFEQKWPQVYACVNSKTQPPNTKTPLSERLGVLNCVFTKAPIDFWKTPGTHDDLLDKSKNWLQSADDRCTFFLDVVTYACDKHDIALSTLQHAVSNNDTGSPANVMDAAWNPRNKYLADWVFKNDIYNHACDPNETGIFVDRAFCDALSNAELANFYFFGVANINNKSWPVTIHDVIDAESNQKFSECQTPTLKKLKYENTEWTIKANWEMTEPCIPGLRTGEFKYDWAGRRPVTTLMFEEDVTTTASEDEYTLTPTDRLGLQTVFLRNFRIEGMDPAILGDPIPEHLGDQLAYQILGPLYLLFLENEARAVNGFVAFANLIKHVLRSGDYTVEQFLFDDFDSRVVILGFNRTPGGNSHTVGVDVTLTVRVGTTLVNPTFTYRWEEYVNNEWLHYTRGVTDGTAIVVEGTPGTRRFRVEVTAVESNRESDGHTGDITDPPVLSGPASATSDEVMVQWVANNAPTPTPTSTATPTPTPTIEESTGVLRASGNSINLNAGVTLSGHYVLAPGKTAELRYPAGISARYTCSTTSGGTIDIGNGLAGAFIRNVYGCTAGAHIVKLLEMPGSVELDRETITVTSAPVTDTPYSHRYGHSDANNTPLVRDDIG